MPFLVTGNLKLCGVGVAFIGMTVIPDSRNYWVGWGHTTHGYVIKLTQESMVIKRIRWTNTHREVVYDRTPLRYEK